MCQKLLEGIAALLLVATVSTGQTVDPLGEARKALQAGRLETARTAFEARLAQMPTDGDALVGAGFTALRQGRVQEAREYFRKVLDVTPRYADAYFGLALISERLGQWSEGKTQILKALALDPARTEFQQARDRLLAQEPDIPPVHRPSQLELNFRVEPTGFQVRQGNSWRPIFLKGVNLGAALPGKYPSEFPGKAIYEGWIRDMDELGINCIRVYTIHPPGFYEALREHNLKSSRPIYLVHGVWTELPPEDDFRNPEWLSGWIAEMRRVVDLIHGRTWIKPRPGHAAGTYLADVSPWSMAYILGREWEPYSVEAFNEKHPGESDWKGRFASVVHGHATERFMAEAMEDLAAYEHDTYWAQRPMAFTNWPTLDPLHHPTESTKNEEMALRATLGFPMEKGQSIKEFDNDGVGLDMEKFAAMPLFQAGFFASYHAYPYYPDFMNLDPGYGRIVDQSGPNNYFGYLQELVRWHRKHAVLISEFGVPSSRLIAHWQAQGMNHGGQDEREQGLQDARMFGNIHASGCAGGILFAWIDEWFKKNWLVIDFEGPLDRKPYWYNVQDAEENYGLIGYHPGEGRPRILIDGHPEDWREVPVYLQEAGLTLKLLADEGWLHIGIFAAGPEGDLHRDELIVGLDTYDAKLGDHQLPFGIPLKSEAGLEFVVVFKGGDAAVYTDEAYDLFTHRYNRPYRSVENSAGRFLMPRTESNRMRLGRDGTVFPAHRQEIGALRKGTQDRASQVFDSRAEWMTSPGFIEARIPWGLLNVTDPSSRSVVMDSAIPGETVSLAKTAGFRAVLARVSRSAEGRDAKVLQAAPAPKNGVLGLPPLFSWAEWEQPTFHAFRKQGFYILRDALNHLPDTPANLR